MSTTRQKKIRELSSSARAYMYSQNSRFLDKPVFSAGTTLGSRNGCCHAVALTDSCCRNSSDLYASAASSHARGMLSSMTDGVGACNTSMRSGSVTALAAGGGVAAASRDVSSGVGLEWALMVRARRDLSRLSRNSRDWRTMRSDTVSWACVAGLAACAVEGRCTTSGWSISKEDDALEDEEKEEALEANVAVDSACAGRRSSIFNCA